MQAKTPPGHIIQQRGEPGHFNPLQETQVNIQLLYRNQFQGEGTKNSTQKEYKSTRGPWTATPALINTDEKGQSN